MGNNATTVSRGYAPQLPAADVLLHVVDVSHPHFQNQVETVNQTLADIGAANKPTILIFNKTDRYKGELDEDISEAVENKPLTLNQLKQTYMAREGMESVFISALTRENINELRSALVEKVKERHFTIFPNYLKGEYY